MPLFVITGYDVADSALLRQSARVEHLARLNTLQQQGRLVIAGPTPIAHDELQNKAATAKALNNDELVSSPAQPQMSGSLIIADFEDLTAAQAWVTDEPYLKTGVYSHVDIKPFVQVF